MTGELDQKQCKTEIIQMQSRSMARQKSQEAGTKVSELIMAMNSQPSQAKLNKDPNLACGWDAGWGGVVGKQHVWWLTGWQAKKMLEARKKSS